MRSKPYISLIILLCFPAVALCQVCFTKYMTTANPTSLTCTSEVPAYTPGDGCTISSSQMVSGCLGAHSVCCNDAAYYEDGVHTVNTITNIPPGQEFEAAHEYYNSVTDGLYAPLCQPGFSHVSEMKAFTYKIEPDAANFGKNQIELTAWNRAGCTKFDNSSTVTVTPYEPDPNGGGSGSTVDLTTTNELLTNIKSSADAIKTAVDTVNQSILTQDITVEMTSTNTILQTIKTALDQMNVEIASQTAPDMTQTELLLTDIKNVVLNTATETTLQAVKALIGSSATSRDALLSDILAAVQNITVTGGSTDMSQTNSLLTGINNNLTFNGVPAGQNLNNIALNTSSANRELGYIKAYEQSNNGYLSDIAHNGLPGINTLLNDIKTLLQNGGGSGGTTTVNVDMTATNDLLTAGNTTATETKDIILGISDNLAAFTDTSGESGAVDAPAVSVPSVAELGDPSDSLTGVRAQLAEQFEYQGKKTAVDVFQAHQATWQTQNEELFNFINSLRVSASASLPVFTLSLPRWGVNWNLDLGDSHYLYAFAVVRNLVIMSALFYAYRIIFRVG